MSEGEKNMMYYSGFQTEVQSTASASPGTLLEMQILRPVQDLLNQKPGGWGPGIPALTSPAGCSDACSGLKPTSLGSVTLQVWAGVPWLSGDSQVGRAECRPSGRTRTRVGWPLSFTKHLSRPQLLHPQTNHKDAYHRPLVSDDIF